MNNILEVRGLNKKYNSFSLNDVSFEIPAGFIMGFIGPNGAGKTTTIKSILNIINYESGEIILFGGNDVKVNNPSHVGVVMDLPFYSEDWTVNEIESAISPFYDKWDTAEYNSLLKKFGLDRKKKIKELSHGMKVKLMLAAALSHNAELLILDEPTSGLDPVARDELCEILSEFINDENKSVLFSTHITSDLEKIADYITFILDGQIVFTGTKEQLLENYVLVKGGLNDINYEQKKLILGLREYGSGFEGMTEIKNIAVLPKNLLIEPISLDEIIVFMKKGDSDYE